MSAFRFHAQDAATGLTTTRMTYQGAVISPRPVYRDASNAPLAIEWEALMLARMVRLGSLTSDELASITGCRGISASCPVSET